MPRTITTLRKEELQVNSKTTNMAMRRTNSILRLLTRCLKCLWLILISLTIRTNSSSRMANSSNNSNITCQISKILTSSKWIKWWWCRAKLCKDLLMEVLGWPIATPPWSWVHPILLNNLRHRPLRSRNQGHAKKLRRWTLTNRMTTKWRFWNLKRIT